MDAIGSRRRRRPSGESDGREREEGRCEGDEAREREKEREWG